MTKITVWRNLKTGQRPVEIGRTGKVKYFLLKGTGCMKMASELLRRAVW
jgi:hypothetical protein